MDKWSEEYSELQGALNREKPEERENAYKEREFRDRIDAAKRKKEAERYKLMRLADKRDRL